VASNTSGRFKTDTILDSCAQQTATFAARATALIAQGARRQQGPEGCVWLHRAAWREDGPRKVRLRGK